MVETDFSGNYLNDENTKEGDIVIITGEGEYVEKENPSTKQKYTILDIPVEIDGLKKTYSVSNDVGKEFVKAWGSDSRAWIGKQAKASLVKYKSFGETKTKVELKPNEPL